MATRPPEGEDEAREALTILAALYPPSQRARFLTRFLDVMEQQFHASGTTPPAWIQTLRAEVRRDEE
jgi:hypothetical protein